MSFKKEIKVKSNFNRITIGLASPEEILDTFAFLCEKNGDDNYTGILAIIEQ